MSCAVTQGPTLGVFSAVAVLKFLKFFNKELHIVILQGHPKLVAGLDSKNSKKGGREEGETEADRSKLERN